jgi:hypothetical protein
MRQLNIPLLIKLDSLLHLLTDHKRNIEYLPGRLVQLNELRSRNNRFLIREDLINQECNVLVL